MYENTETINISQPNIQDANIIHPYPIPSSIQSIIGNYGEGVNCIYAIGSLDEFEIHPNGSIQKRTGILQDILIQEYGLVTVYYSLSTGIHYDRDFLSSSEIRSLEGILDSCGLSTNNGNIQDDEFLQIMRGIFSLTRNRNDYSFDDGRPMRVAMIVEFSHHLIPCTNDVTYLSNPQKSAIELVQKLTNSMELRASNHYIVFNGKDNLPSDLSDSIHVVNIPYPSITEKELFAKKALELYKKASLEKDLNPRIMANLSANTGNNSLERLIRRSHKANITLTTKAISKKREEDIIAISEGTLAVLPTDRVKGVTLVGQNVLTPLEILLREADNVKNSNNLSNSNILLVGPPGVAKTDMVAITSLKAGLPAYNLLSPKGSLVGETERKVRVQNSILKSHKNIAFSDEFSKTVPTGSQSSNLDSGASDAVVGAYQEYLSDKSRAGEQLFIATTNTIWHINDALLRRFEIVPVLMPLEEDYPLILSTIWNQIFSKHLTVTEKDSDVIKASKIFFSKFASPRHIAKSLRVMGSQQKTITPKDLIQAATNLSTHNNRVNTIYCELSALQSCSHNQFLPWFGKKSYNFPSHIRNVIDTRTGEVIHSKVAKEMKALEPYINI